MTLCSWVMTRMTQGCILMNSQRRKIWFALIAVTLVLALVAVILLPRPYLSIQYSRELSKPVYAELSEAFYRGAPLAEIRSIATGYEQPLEDLHLHGVPLLNIAIGSGRQDVMEWLLESGYPPEGPGFGPSPLMRAVNADCVPCAELLLAYGADPTSPVPPLGLTPIQIIRLTPDDWEQFGELFESYSETD